VNYFKLLRAELARAYMVGALTKEQASAIAQRINKAQANYAGRGAGINGQKRA